MGHLGAILWPYYWPSRGHLGSILRHFSVTTSEDGRCIADFAKCARRPHESAILSILASSWDHLGAIFGPSWAILGPSWLILGPLRATLGLLGPSRRADRRRHSQFSKICISLTREHHFGGRPESVLGPSWGRLRAVLGRLGTIQAHFGPSSGHFGPSRAFSERGPTTA